MICKEHENLLSNIPLVVQGSDQYNKSETIKYICLIMAYNAMRETKKKIPYSTLMKPLDKNGNQKGKFVQLTTNELKACTEEAERIVSAIRYLEQAAEHQEHERQRIAEKSAIEPSLSTAAETLVEKKALMIYEKGLFLKYSEKVFGKIWYKDSFILRALMYVAASYHVLNSDDGLHLHVGGTTQSGKSDSVKAALKLIHPQNRLTKAFSDKWLFYASEKQEIWKDMMLFTDDTHLSPDSIGLFRNILTSWHDGVERGVVINHESVNLKIPPHVNLILTSIDEVVGDSDSDEGQDESRFLSMEVKRTPDDLKAIREFVQDEKADVRKHLATIHKVWEIMPFVEVKAHKKFDNEMLMRDFKRFLTLVKANALLYNRTETTDEDVEQVQQFLTYSRTMIDATTAAYSRKEKAVLSVLTNQWMTTDDIETETGMSVQNVYRALHGVKGTFFKPGGGLLLKCKNIRITQNPDTKIFSFKN